MKTIARRAVKLSLLILIVWTWINPIEVIAQPPRGSVTGTVVSTDGAPIVGASIELVSSDRASESALGPSRTRSNHLGEFNFLSLAKGKYILTISDQYFGPEMERAITIKSKETIDLRIVMGIACADADVSQDLVSEEDRTQVLKIALKEAIARLLSASERKKTLILSTKNIPVDWLSKIESAGVEFMSPEIIQGKADKEGDFVYMSFSEVRVERACLAVSVDSSWAVGKKSTVMHLSGSGITFEFRKKNGRWVGTKVLEWVS